ncbi:MAG: hypothetical protein WC447_01615 [Candidatus Paceibacterota bacterium]
MNKKIFLGVLATILIIAPFSSFGATFKAEESLFLDPTTKINGNLYAASSNVNISGPVGGDLFAAGGTVMISGPVSGDLLSAGGTLILNGKILGDMRVLGGNVTISNSVDGELIALGGQLSVFNGVLIAKDAELLGGNINYSGETGGNLDVKGETVYINGVIKDNLTIKAREIKLGPNASIGKNFEYYSPKEAVVETGATVKGETSFHQVDMPSKNKNAERVFLGFITTVLLLKLLTIIAITLLAFYLCKKQASSIVGEVMTNFWRETGRGFILLVVVPIASILSFITILGAPLGFIAMLLYVALIIASIFITVLVFAKLVVKYIFRRASYELNWWVIVLSALVLAVISIIPVIGFIFTFILFLSAFGSLTNYVYKKLKE